MQRITLDSEISYVVTEKELKEIRAEERRKMADELAEKSIEFMADENEKCKCVDCFFRWLYMKGGAENE